MKYSDCNKTLPCNFLVLIPGIFVSSCWICHKNDTQAGYISFIVPEFVERFFFSFALDMASVDGYLCMMKWKKWGWEWPWSRVPCQHLLDGNHESPESLSEYPALRLG
jgi:hypothetical protein